MTDLAYKVLISTQSGSERQIVQTESYEAARRIAAHRVRQNASRHSTQIVHARVERDGKTLCSFERSEMTDRKGTVNVSVREAT